MVYGFILFNRFIVTGNPVRPQLCACQRAEDSSNMRIAGLTSARCQKGLVVVLGGSLGCRRLNDIMCKAAPLILSKSPGV